MPGEIPEPVLKHIIDTSKAIGSIDARLAAGDQTMKRIEAQQEKLATKDELYEKVDAGIDEHVQAYHPSEAEIVGQQVLNRRAAIKAWVAGHPKSSSALTIISLVLSYFGLELKGLI